MDIAGGSVGLRCRPAIAPASPCAPLLQSKRWQAALTGIKDSSRSTKTFRVVMRLTGRRDGGNRDGPQQVHAKQHACLSNLCGQYVFFMIVNVAHACNSSKSRSSSGEPQALALHWTLGINKAGNNDLLKLKRHAESERERERDRSCLRTRFGQDVVGGVHNLSDAESSDMFYAAAHTGVIFDYNTGVGHSSLPIVFVNVWIVVFF